MSKVWLALIVVGTFLLRVLPQWDIIFVKGQVWFRGVDAWYHMRLADNLMTNFPVPLTWDAYANSGVGFYPLTSWVIAGFGRLGLNCDLVGVFLPPIIGCLVIILVYFLGRKLFGKGVALLGCLLVAVLPGEFLHRTMLGFADQHMFEVLFMVVTILLLLNYKKVGYAIGAGFTLGLYMLNWHGAAFFLFILGVWYAIEFFTGKVHTRNFLLVIAVATVISFTYLRTAVDGLTNLTALGLLLLVPMSLEGLSYLIKDRRTFYWTIGSISVVGLVVANYILVPILIHEGADLFSLFGPVFWGFGSAIGETLPTSPTVAFSAYGISFLLFFGGLYYAHRNKVSMLFLVWSTILLLATIGQRRWGYYFTIPLSLLTAYFVFEVSKWTKPNLRSAAVVVTCFFLIFPTVRGTVGVAVLENNIDKDWYNTCVWLKENTPDQFGSPVPTIEVIDSYHQIFPESLPGHIQGVAVDEKYLYVSHSNAIKKTCKDSPDFVNPLAEVILTNPNVFQINALTIKDNYLYTTGVTCDYEEIIIKKFNTKDLSLIDEVHIPSPWEEGSFSEGCTYYDNSWWVVDFDQTQIARYDDSWNLIGKYRTTNWGQGGEWIGNYFWLPRSKGKAISVFKYINGVLEWVGRSEEVPEMAFPQDIALDDNILWQVDFTDEPYDSILWKCKAQYGDTYYELNVQEQPDYLILSWWDYGHWILRIGHRAPISSPAHQTPEEVAQFYVAQSEEEAIEFVDAKYVLVDKAMVTGKWFAIVEKAFLPVEESQSYLENSMANKLWQEESEYYKLVHQEGDVKIFEKL